jgi:hypothetical protein
MPVEKSLYWLGPCRTVVNGQRRAGYKPAPARPMRS